MYISTSHRVDHPQIEVGLTTPQHADILGEFTLTLGDARIHLTRDQAERLSLELTSAFAYLLGDLESVRTLETA